MPLPPPPAAGLTMSGQPDARAPRAPGARGPARCPRSRAAPARRRPPCASWRGSSSPWRAMLGAGGPTKISPACVAGARELPRSRRESRSRDGWPPRRGARRGEDARRVEVAVARRRRARCAAPRPRRARGARRASASENTAMVRIPRRRAVRKMRQAISPRLATSRLLITAWHLRASHPKHAEARGSCGCVLRAGASDSARTRRVSCGSMTPSSQSRAEA